MMPLYRVSLLCALSRDVGDTMPSAPRNVQIPDMQTLNSSHDLRRRSFSLTELNRKNLLVEDKVSCYSAFPISDMPFATRIQCGKCQLIDGRGQTEVLNIKYIFKWMCTIYLERDFCIRFCRCRRTWQLNQIVFAFVPFCVRVCDFLNYYFRSFASIIHSAVRTHTQVNCVSYKNKI